MGDIVTELRNDAMRFWLPNSEARRRSTVVAAADELVRLRALLGNAVGAIIDSGGYCDGPHDVAAAIYRLTEDRDAALGAMRGVSEAFVIADPAAAKFYLQALRDGQIPQSAVGGAPGVSETHTDPKEAADDEICMTHSSYRKPGTRICMVLAFVDEPGKCRFVHSGPPPATTENQA